jgi:glyoxylase-like metal-dependent hydrolase (beta-lactamase superfamily II)
MFSLSDRRDFLRLLLGGTTGLSVSALAGLSQAFAQEHAHDPAAPKTPGVPAAKHAQLAATRLTDNLVLITGAGGNVVVVIGPDGLAMVNGGVQAHSAALLKLVAEQAPGKRVTTLFNTDWHPDHSGSNETLGKAGATIIAHENTKLYMGNENFVDWQNRMYKPLAAQALPNKTFYTSEKTTFGKERIEYAQLGMAHTDGDMYAFFPDANVLVAGDVVTVGTYPIGDYTCGGWLGGLMTATKTLLDLANEQTRVIPGEGPVLGKADLQAQYDMLKEVRDRMPKLMRQGKGREEIVASGITKEFDARWGDPKLFLSVSLRGLMIHVRELGGIV